MLLEQEIVGHGDEMNKEPSHGRTRQKYVHQQGVVTKARFVPTQNDRGYTGIF